MRLRRILPPLVERLGWGLKPDRDVRGSERLVLLLGRETKERVRPRGRLSAWYIPVRTSPTSRLAQPLQNRTRRQTEGLPSAKRGAGSGAMNGLNWLTCLLISLLYQRAWSKYP